MASTLGQKLAALRAARRLTLRQVALSTGLAESFLSKLEHDRVNISVANLRKLARTYGVPMIHFFENEDERPACVVVRADGRLRLAADGCGVAIELLSPRRQSGVQVVLRTLRPGALGGPAEVGHGEEFTHVLQGRVRYEVDGQTHELVAGDSILYRRSAPHTWLNPGETEAVLLTVYAPPSL